MATFLMKEKEPQSHSTAPTILGRGTEKVDTWELLHPIYVGYLIPSVRCQVQFLELTGGLQIALLSFFFYLFPSLSKQIKRKCLVKRKNKKETSPFGLNFYLKRVNSPTNMTSNTLIELSA